MTDTVEKVAAIPDAAVEAALVAWYTSQGSGLVTWPGGVPVPHRPERKEGMRAAISAALAAMAGDASAGAGIADVAEMMRLGRAAMAGEAEPVAWRFEIADAVVHNDDGTKTGAKWRVVLSPIEPCVPEWGIRNLTPLYAPAEG